jgi:hypothetical protein
LNVVHVLLRDTIHRVTVQTIPFAVDAVMLLSALAVLALLTAAGVQAMRRRLRAAAGLACVAGAAVVIYGAVDVGVGLASRPVQLRPGDAKCFDDWCAAMVGARRDGTAGTVLVDVRLENRGRGRAMRSDLARAYLEIPGGGRVAPADGSPLMAFLQAGESRDVELSFAAPPDRPGTRLVVVEGGDGFGPGTFEISGEASPFHARAGWPL